LPEGALDHGAAPQQLAVGDAGDEARAEKVSGQQPEVAAPVHLDGSLWAFPVEAHGVGRLFSGNGDGLAN
jgi:hypothetical protein